MRALPFLLVVGCASSSPPPEPTTPGEPAVAEPAGGPLSEAECSAAFTHDFQLTARDPQLLPLMGEVRANYILTCVQEFDRARHFDCTMRAQDAAAIDACARPELGQHTPPASLPAPSCERPEAFGPIIVTAEQFLARSGAGATKLSGIAGTAEQPLENCGLMGTLFQLGRLTCDDGSRPFKSFADIEGGRRGSTGEGGRCGSVLDLYVVPCPEKSYEIHTDMYMCLPDAWPR